MQIQPIYLCHILQRAKPRQKTPHTASFQRLKNAHCSRQVRKRFFYSRLGMKKMSIVHVSTILPPRDFFFAPAQ